MNRDNLIKLISNQPSENSKSLHLGEILTTNEVAYIADTIIAHVHQAITDAEVVIEGCGCGEADVFITELKKVL